MFLNTEYIVLSVLATAIFVITTLTSWRPWPLKRLAHASGAAWAPLRAVVSGDHHHANVPAAPLTPAEEKRVADRGIREVFTLADCHETAARLADLVRHDGAGSWPPRAMHSAAAWPEALRPYRAIYDDMAPRLPAADISTDDAVNTARVTAFRGRFDALLAERVDLDAVTRLLAAADAGRWDVFPRDAYNAFYCCIAWCRHAYRWGTIPAVRVAQVEKEVTLPAALVAPWAVMQRHFGLCSDSGNMMSNLVLNFDADTGVYAYRINTGLAAVVTASEEEFARVAHEMERRAVPVYRDMVSAIIAHARGDGTRCLAHVRAMTAQLRPLLSSYYDRVHDGKIARSVWLSRVQGFYAWAAGHQDDATGEWEKFDGLSGNQVLLFQALDAFLGYAPYLPRQVLDRNVSARQRDFCAAVARHSFRRQLAPGDGVEGAILSEMLEIVKRLRVRFSPLDP